MSLRKGQKDSTLECGWVAIPSQQMCPWCTKTLCYGMRTLLEKTFRMDRCTFSDILDKIRPYVHKEGTVLGHQPIRDHTKLMITLVYLANGPAMYVVLSDSLSVVDGVVMLGHAWSGIVVPKPANKVNFVSTCLKRNAVCSMITILYCILRLL